MSKPCTLDLSVVKAQGSIDGFLFFLPFCHSRNIFTDHFVTERIDFGIVFSIKFLSSLTFLGFRKALEEDAIPSSVSRRKVQNTCEIPKMFSSYANFQHSRKHNCYEIY